MNIPKQKLEAVRAQLKVEFDGIDEIIDQVINIISSWNSNVVRPIVVPVFGMTGVGKTSMINRLIELLGLLDKTYNIPIGVSTEGDSNTRPAKVFFNALGFSDYDNSKSITEVDPASILILDEIQQLKTIDEDGNEQKTEFNELWKLLDNGKLDYVSTYATEKARFEKWIMAMNRYLLPKHGDAIVENALTTDEGVIDELISMHLVNDSRRDILRWSGKEEREFKSLDDIKSSIYQDSDKSFQRALDVSFEIVPNDEDDDIITLSLAPFRTREDVRNALQELTTVDEVKQFLSSIMKKQTLREYCETLNNMMKFINEPHYVDFHQSLIFLIGNLDEAFQLAKDLDPDIDADVFHKLTKEVSINDIKTALLKRFRPEQIARFGNNYVIYPSFNKETFRKIIKRYFENDIESYYKNTGIKVTYDSNIIDLIYSEGVFPSQGTRPVMSTVSAFGFVFNEIDGIKGNLPGINRVHIKLENGVKDFKTDKVNIIIQAEDTGSNTHIKTIPYHLYLGKLRNPKNDKGRYLKAVHELGHAIMNGLETGNLPSSIITTSSANSGGFCMRNIKDIQKKDISNIDMMKSNIRIALGGWVAERLMFDEDLCSLGASSDISEIWNEISYAYFTEGYVAPIAFGRGDKPDGIPHGIEDPSIIEKIETSLYELKEEVEKKITKYLPLIGNISGILGDKGSFTEEELEETLRVFLEEKPCVDENGNNLVEEFYKEMNKRKDNKPSPEYYSQKIKDKLSEKKKEKNESWFKKLIKKFEKNLD